MFPAAEPPVPSPISTGENNLQPFFVLHRASPPRKSAAKTRRRIELSPKKSGYSTEELDDSSRFETFKSIWSNTESIISDVLKNINSNVFDKIDKWIHESFGAICARRNVDDVASETVTYPILDNASKSIVDSIASRQIFTALLCTKNIEFVDDVLTFSDLGERLRSRGSYVASLTSLDFSSKNGVGGCLKTLLRQFLMISIDAPDMSILASWYAEQDNYENPLVVIIDDVERCCGTVLADFIIMLREWVIKVPIILILGVATTVDVLRNIICSNAYSNLSLCEFTLGTPSERMDAVVDAMLLENCESFSIGKLVSIFLRNYFLRHDGTLTLFIRAIKIALVQHVLTEPLIFTLRKLADEGAKGFDGESLLQKETMLKRALDLPSLQRCSLSGANPSDWACGLSELIRRRKLWSSIVRCLYEVGKYHKITLLDLYCEMLEPDLHKFNACDPTRLANNNTNSSYDNQPSFQNESSVLRLLQIVRDLPAVELCKVIQSWVALTRDATEIHEKVKDLQSLAASKESRPKRDPTEYNCRRRPSARNHINDETPDKNLVNEQVATFLRRMVRECIQPIESIPFNEVVVFNNADKLQTALIGDPRKRIQADLLESRKFLKCPCCSNNVGGLVPSMHDTSIMYSLAQEHGDLINLHEWFHSFKAIVTHSPSQAKKKSRPSPSPKKRKDSSNDPPNISDAAIQARFCRAVTELQITGLLRMPSKRRPDYVQRVAFGL